MVLHDRIHFGRARQKDQKIGGMIRPRLTDHHAVYVTQTEVDFAIPFLDEDIPLYVDPFLLWRSPAQQDKALHLSILNSFNRLGLLAKDGNKIQAVSQLVMASECDEVGLGHSAHRIGKRFGTKTAEGILELFEKIPSYEKRGFAHFEEIQLYVDGISADRISDIACNFMKSFLVDYTMDQCERWKIPIVDCTVTALYNPSTYSFDESVGLTLPVHPISGAPLLLVPKRWLRFGPWISFEDYFKSYCPQDEKANPAAKPLSRVEVLHFNRDNYGMVEKYISEKERTFEDCKNDPLFQQIPVLSAKRKLAEIKSLKTGKNGNADKAYENAVGQLICSLLYPHLDFADEQSRTDSGVLIRDIIFYNNRSHEFLEEIFDQYGSRQIVMELKNVKSVERDHINQLNRYMADDLGRFGVLITRNELNSARRQNTVDLWSGQRRCIITLTDADLAQMVELFESKQRLPIDVLKKKYAQFRRACPT
ncbi:MAG TPA: hypothetical protein V6C81_07275 [Planktothrix sp.]